MSDTTFKDAEAFLEDLGVERRTMEVRLPDDEDGGSPGADTTDTIDATMPDGASAGALSDTDVADDPVAGSGGDDVDAEERARLDEAVAAAIGFIRASTAASPASEGRLRRKLQQRDTPEAVIDAAMQQARDERLVDDDAMAAALVAEWRAKGHAPRRLRADLRKREFDDDVVERAVAVAEDDEPLAAAFGLAKERAEKMRHVDAETAFRRIHRYLGRRGHGDAIARKAARDAVFANREDERQASR